MCVCVCVCVCTRPGEIMELVQSKVRLFLKSFKLML